MANGSPVGNMIIKVDLDSTGVEKSMTGLQRQLKSSNKAMGAQLSAFNRSEKSVSKYNTIIDGLTNRHKIQAAMVDEAKQKYEEMSNTYGENSVKAQAAAQDLNTQIQRYQETGRELSNIQAEFKEFQRVQEIQSKTWYKVVDGMENYGGKLKTAGASIDDVGSKMTKSITLPAAGAALAVGGVAAAFGWKRLTGLDTAQAKLKGLGYSAKDVERISKDVETAIEGGMTTFAEGTDIAAGALAAGVKEGKDLQRYIKLVGDAAVGANRPVAEMAQIFNRVEGNGKLMTQELNSIEMSMPGFSKAMSKHLGVSSDKFREMVTDGKVSSKDFLKVMDSFAGDMAKEYSKTWDGMVANTKAYVGIIGESFLQGVFEDSKKSLADFIEVLKSPEIQQRAAEMGEVAREAFTKMKDSIKGAVDWYQGLDDEQKTLIKRLGFVAIAGGPVLQMTGKLTSGIGSVMEVTGKLTKAIGLSGGVGLVGALGGLAPTAVVGVAVAGAVLLGSKIAELVDDTEKLEDVNLDLAESLSDQASDLEASANTFDKLSDKAKLSNSELAELHDLNQRISKSSNPSEIEALQQQYNKLAEKSGLSKDEIKRLFGANDELIKQSPVVKKSVSEQGNEFVNTTDKVRDQIEALRKLSETQLTAEREKILKNEEQIIDNIAQKTDELAVNEQRITDISKNQNMSKQEISDRVAEINDKISEGNLSEQEAYKLDAERNDLLSIKNGTYDEILDQLIEEQNQLQKGLDKEEEKLDKLEATEQQLANIKLQNMGINEEGEKGLSKLDESIAKNDEELEKLEQKLAKNGELTEEERERYTKLSETNNKKKEGRDALLEELGIMNNLNTVAEDRMSRATKTTQNRVEELAETIKINAAEGNIIKQIDNKNVKLDKSIDKAKEEGKEQGLSKKEIEKQVNSLEKKKGKNAEVKKQIMQELGIWDDVDSSIQDQINKEIKKGKATDDTTSKSKKQGDQIGNNNKKTDEGTKKEKERSKEAGKNVSKDVKVSDKGTVNNLNRRASEKKSKNVGLVAIGLAALNRGATQGKSKKVSLWQSGLASINRQASSPVSKTINFVGRGLSKLKFWAKGTPPQGHTGGHAVMGEEGRELATLPSGHSFLTASTATLYPNLPKGTHVIPHRETENILKSFPHYADGTNNWSSLFNHDNLMNNELMKLLAVNNKSTKSEVAITADSKNNSDNKHLRELVDVTLQQNQQQGQMIDLLTQLLAKETDIVIDVDSLGKGAAKSVSKQQDKNTDMRLRYAGLR